MKKFFLVFVCSVTLFLASCNDAERKPIEVINYLDIPIESKPAVIKVDSIGLSYLYSDKKAVIYQSNGQKISLSDQPGGEHWLYYDGNDIYAIWWGAKRLNDKKSKYLMMRVSHDKGKSFEKPVQLNSYEDVLGDVAVLGDGHGRVLVTYTDERVPGYQIYYNRTEDAGKTWLASDIRLDTSLLGYTSILANAELRPFANTAKLAYIKNQLVAVWQQADMANDKLGLRFVYKVSNDFGKTWSEVKEIASFNSNVAQEFVVGGSDSGIILLSTTDQAELMGFFLKDPSQPWQKVEAKGLIEEGAYASTFKVSFSGDNIIVAYLESKQGVKDRANVITFSTKDLKWVSKAHRLDRDKGHDLTRASIPAVASQGNEVIAVWEDYRTLVPTIYADISKDQGLTWLEKPISLTTPGLTVSNYPQVFLDKNKAFLFYITGVLFNGPTNAKYAYQSFDLNSNTALKGISEESIALDKKKLLLIDRVNKFWALREDKKWEETWDYMEPMYQQRFDKQEWLSQQGKLSFRTTVVDESSVDIKGNLATITAKTQVGMGQQITKQGVIESMPAQAQSLTMRWGWFYDNWYFVPDLLFGDHLKY